MRGLKLVVLTADAERFRGALMLAAAQAALGGDVKIFLQLDAVALLDNDAETGAPRDADHRAAGLPTLQQLITEARELGVRIIACQSGLALTQQEADALPDGIAVGGSLAFLQSCDDADRLLVV